MPLPLIPLLAIALWCDGCAGFFLRGEQAMRAKEPELDSLPSKNVAVPQIYAAHEMLAVDTTVAALETTIESINNNIEAQQALMDAVRYVLWITQVVAAFCNVLRDLFVVIILIVLVLIVQEFDRS